MARQHQVRFAFSAKQLNWEPLQVELFDVGAHLVVLSSDDGYTAFCRKDDDADLVSRPRFIISQERFTFLTEPL